MCGATTSTSTATLAADRDQCAASKDKAEKKLRGIIALDDDSEVGEDEVDAHVKALINAAANDPATPVSDFSEDSAPAEKKFLAALIAFNAAEDALAAAQQEPLAANGVPAPMAAPLGAGNLALLVQKMDAQEKQMAAMEKQMAALRSDLLAAADPDVEIPDSLCVTGANHHPSRNRMLKAQGKPEVPVDEWTGVYTPVLQNGELLLIDGQQLYQLGNEDKFLCYREGWRMQGKEQIMAKSYDCTFTCTKDTKATEDPTTVVWKREVWTVDEDGKDTMTEAEFDSMHVQPFTNQPVYVTDSEPREVDLSGLYEPTGEIRNGVPVYQQHDGDLVLSLSTEFSEHGNYVIAKPATAAGQSEKIYSVLDIDMTAGMFSTIPALDSAQRKPWWNEKTLTAHKGSWEKGMFAVVDGKKVCQLTYYPNGDGTPDVKYADGSSENYVGLNRLSPMNARIRQKMASVAVWKSCNYTPDGRLAALPEHAKPGFTCEPSVSLY